MNLANWTEYTLRTFLSVIWRMIVNGVGGTLAGLLIVLVYNAVAGLWAASNLSLINSTESCNATTVLAVLTSVLLKLRSVR